MEYLGSERLQTNFSEDGAFLVNCAVAGKVDDATTNFFLNSKSPVSRLSNDIFFVSFLLWEVGQNSKNVRATSLPFDLFW